MFVPIILGTGRKNANSEKVSEFVFDLANKCGFNVKLIKVREWLDQPWTGGMDFKKREKLSQIFKEADGFLIVSPEYNHSFPGELKLLLDEFYEEYHFKPVGICGVSTGKLGGARMVEQLKLTLITFSMILLKNTVYFSNVESFEKDKKDYEKYIEILFNELKSYIEKLKKL